MYASGSIPRMSMSDYCSGIWMDGVDAARVGGVIAVGATNSVQKLVQKLVRLAIEIRCLQTCMHACKCVWSRFRVRCTDLMLQ